MSNDMALFQDNLYLVRSCLGISSRDFSKMIGISRTSLWHYETGKYDLTLTVYLAMLWVFQRECLKQVSSANIEEHNNATAAMDVIGLCLNPSDYSEEERYSIIKEAVRRIPPHLRKKGQAKITYERFFKKNT